MEQFLWIVLGVAIACGAIALFLLLWNAVFEPWEDEAEYHRRRGDRDFLRKSERRE